MIKYKFISQLGYLEPVEFEVPDKGFYTLEAKEEVSLDFYNYAVTEPIL